MARKEGPLMVRYSLQYFVGQPIRRYSTSYLVYKIRWPCSWLKVAYKLSWESFLVEIKRKKKRKKMRSSQSEATLRLRRIRARKMFHPLKFFWSYLFSRCLNHHFSLGFCTIDGVFNEVLPF